MHQSLATARRAGFLATLLLGTTALASAGARAQPDFSGAWTVYRGAPVTGAVAAPTAQMQLKPAAQKAYDDYRSLIDGTNYAPGNACVGYGMPDSMLSSGVYPMEILQRPDQLLVIYESHSEMRRFHINGAAEDAAKAFPERNGYSIARWEGERLIVETSRLKTQVDTRYPHSNQATIREEYYFGEPLEDGSRVLVAELTMQDPLWLEAPFVTTKRWLELKDYHVLSYECSEPKWLDEMEQLYDAAGLPMVQD